MADEFDRLTGTQADPPSMEETARARVSRPRTQADRRSPDRVLAAELNVLRAAKRRPGGRRGDGRAVGDDTSAWEVDSPSAAGPPTPPAIAGLPTPHSEQFRREGVWPSQVLDRSAVRGLRGEAETWRLEIG